jgi:hypothetical protein
MRYKNETLEVALPDCQPHTNDEQPRPEDLKRIPRSFFLKADTVHYWTQAGRLIVLKSRHSKS